MAREIPAGYQDVFGAPLAPGDARTAEQLMRAGLEGAPLLVRRTIPVIHRWILLLRLGPMNDPDHVLGWRIAESAPGRAVLRADSPLAEASMVGERDQTTLRLTTTLRYRRPLAATLVWTAVAPLHRRLAPLLLSRAARSAPVDAVG